MFTCCHLLPIQVPNMQWIHVHISMWQQRVLFGMPKNRCSQICRFCNFPHFSVSTVCTISEVFRFLRVIKRDITKIWGLPLHVTCVYSWGDVARIYFTHVLVIDSTIRPRCHCFRDRCGTFPKPPVFVAVYGSANPFGWIYVSHLLCLLQSQLGDTG